MGTIARLAEKRKRLIGRLPGWEEILRATVSTVYLRCGCKSCGCHRGGKKHGPFVYLSRSEGGKTKTHFVPGDLEAAVKEGVAKYQALWKGIYAICEVNRALLWERRKERVGQRQKGG